ncbi:MAG: TolC family protein [Phycisphaerae bacterium]|nr:TolC family protein [Phycisphaerae bacterium]
MSRFDPERRTQKAERRRGTGALCCSLILVLLGGCGVFEGTGGPAGRATPEQDLRQIRPLDPDQARDRAADANAPSEALPPAPATMELTLEQCRVMALQNNLALKATLINPTLSEERLNQERAKFEAVFSANANLNRSDTPAVSYYDEIYGSQVESLYTDVGVQKPLNTGGSVSLRATDAQTETDAVGTAFNPYYGSDLTFSISQPLLRNLGRASATYSIRIAALDRRITDARTRMEVIRLIADLDRLYWRLYAARRELDVRRQQMDLAQAQLDQAGRLVEKGQVAPVEIVRAQAGVAQRQEAIIVAENSLRSRQRELKRLIRRADLGMQTPTTLVPLTEPVPTPYVFDPDPLIRSAIENRMEMIELELQLAQDALTIDYQRNQSLPLVTFDYTYNLNGMGESRGDSWDMVTDNDFADHRLGLRLQVPIGNEAAKSRVRQAVYQKCQRLATREDRRSQVEQEVLSALSQLQTNWQRIMASRQNTLLQGRVYDAERRQFEQGLRTSTDVLNAQAGLADAQSSEIAALTEYQIALVDLAYATGTLLGASNIEWQPIRPDAEEL